MQATLASAPDLQRYTEIVVVRRFQLYLIACFAFFVAGCMQFPSSDEVAMGPDRTNQPWGQEKNGVRTRLVPAETSFSLDQPMRFRLEMQNVGSETVQFDPQQVDVNNSVIIAGPGGKELPYIAPWCQTLGGPRPLKPGEQVVLFDGLDIAEQYLVTEPGQYTVQFRGQDQAFGEVPIPPSNTIRIQVTDGPLRTSRAIASHLVSVTPEARWKLSVVSEGEVTPSGRSSTRGVHLYLVRRAALKSDLVFVHFWVTERPTDVVEERTGQTATIAEHLGHSQWGDVYMRADAAVTRFWPEIRRDIRKALKLVTR